MLLLFFFGELLVGVALIVGAAVGIAALFGALMNWNFTMAGSASTNPLLYLGAILPLIAWKIAGCYRADYYLLHYLGTPWRGHKTVEAKSPLEQTPSPGRVT